MRISYGNPCHPLALQLTRKELPRLNGDKGAPQPGHFKIIVDSLRWETKACLPNLPCPMTWPFTLTTIKCAQFLSHVRLFVTPWTVARQAPLTMGFPRQEYWSRLPFSPPGDLPDPGIEPMSPASPTLADGLFTTEPSRKSACFYIYCIKCICQFKYILSGLIQYFIYK